MKRGNTALKRGVGLASAFALAIAGAVIAAPAANAWTATQAVDTIRATPAVDAPYLSTPLNYSNVYSGANNTAVPNLVIGQNSQAANGLQIKLPVATTGLPNWASGETVQITLGSSATAGATGVKFSNVPTTISLSKKTIVSADLAKNAGHPGANATVATSGDGTLANNTVTGTLSGSGQVLTITLPNPASAVAQTGTVADFSYLLSVEGIRLDVPADQSPANSAVTANLTTTGANLFATANTNVTTIAYTSSLKLALDGNASNTGTTVSLPPIVVAESIANAFSATASNFQITVDGTRAVTATPIALVKPTTATVVASNTVTHAGPVALSAADLAVATTVGTLSYNASDATKSETVVISGLQVTGVKPGTDLTLSITAPVVTPAINSAGGAFSFTAPQDAQASVVIKPGELLPRVAGANRYATAGDIAATLGVTDSVIIANGENAKQGIDALSANFLAGVKGAPILLTQAGTLSPDTKAALTSLFKSSTAHITVYVMGKTDSVSQAVRDEIVSTIKATAISAIATVTVTEVAGDDRYETSVKTLAAAGGSTSAAYYDLGKGNLRTAFLASGQTNADALAAGAVSAGSAIPVLLTTNGKALPESVKAAIAASGIKQVVILGSTDRVSQDVEDALKADGVNVLRLAGTGSNGRFDTAVKIAELDRTAPTNGTGKATGSTVYIANGVGGWADALAAGPLVAKGHNSLITVNDGASLPVSATLFLSSNKGVLDGAVGLGGKDRVSDAVIVQATALVS